MSVKFLILGGLMFSCSHGYGIKSQLPKKMFGEFGINDGQLYPTLRKLEEGGLVRKTVEHQEGSPSRHIYSLTDEGRSEFMRWLEDNDGEERTFRYDFFRKDVFCLKANFIRFLEREKAAAKIRHQMQSVENVIADLNSARDHMKERSVDSLHIKIMEYGIRLHETRLMWLDEFLKEVEKCRK